MEQANDDSSVDDGDQDEESVINEAEEERKSSWEEDSSSESGSESNDESDSSANEESESEENVACSSEALVKKEMQNDLDKESLQTKELEGITDPSKVDQSKKKGAQEDSKYWETNPEIYGIRRSSRARKEPERLNIKVGSESDSETGKGRKAKKDRRRKRLSSDNIPTLTSESDSESSHDSLPKQRARPGQKKSFRSAHVKSTSQRQSRSRDDDHLPLVSDEDSRDRSQRSRRKTANVKYKEHSDESTDEEDIIEQKQDEKVDLYPDAETIEKVLMHRHGRPGVTGAMTTIYAVEAPELESQGEPNPTKEPTEVQYLIKWKDWAHIHNTWESEKSLEEQHVKGLKKFANYTKRIEEIEKWKKIATPEDVEYFQCQLELNQEIYRDYKVVERIIAHQYTGDAKSSSYPDYLCKWQGLPYAECTWEDGALIARFYQDVIDSYLKRENNDKVPSRNNKVLKQRPKFVPLKSQPSYIGVGPDNLELRNYQLDGVNWIVHAWTKENSVILADEMGLGKTIQAISFLSHLFNAYSLHGPFLVVVPLSTMAAWQREFQLWAPDINVVVYIGDVNSRTKIQEYEWCFKNRRLKFNVILTTYEMLLKDKELLGSIYWAVVMVDEAHRLKNDDSLLYRSLVDFRTNYRLLITGTPLQNSLKELWSLLHFIMPERFTSFEDFELQYSTKEMKGYQKLHRELEPFLLRRVKKDVEKSLPAKVEQILRVEMSAVQKQYYKWILTKNFKELNKGLKGNASGFLNIVVELKKTCNHANLIRPVEVTPAYDALQTLIRGSGKMILLDKLLTRLKERGNRVLIFSQMVRMLDLLADYLARKRFQFQRLDGSIRGDLRKQALDHFNADGSTDFCFLLSTRAGGLGVNLATADTVIIFDSDWNPQNDLQAMARAHRIGQRRQVKIYRLITKGSIEEDIIERAKKKMVLDHLVIQRMDTTGKKVLSKTSSAPSTTTPFNKEELAAILKFGAEELFKETDGEEDEKLQKMDIDAILDSAETHESEDHRSTMGEELLSQFKVANFGTFEEDEETVEKSIDGNSKSERTWEDIIPEKERQKLAEEEEHLKRMELFLPPRKRKKVEKIDLDDFEPELEKKLKKSRKRAHTDTSSADESAGENEDKPKRKRGRPRTVKRDDVEGFADVEIRRFVKSFKKFARPMTRLDAIAADAELQEKSMTDINRLANLIHSGCEQAVKDYQEKLVQDPNFDGKKRGASLKLSGITINAPSFLKAEEELEALAVCLPDNAEERLKYRLAMSTRNVHWGIKWDVFDDSMLLVGMYQYGVGSWEAIKNDQSLKLTAKILPPGDAKPQEKHLHSRAEYLLKLLKLHCSETEKINARKVKAKLKRKTQKDGRSSGSSFVSSVPEAVHIPPVKNETLPLPVAVEDSNHVHSESSMDKPELEVKPKKSKKEKLKETEKEYKKEKEKKGKGLSKPSKSADESLQTALEDSSSQSSLVITEVADMSQSTFSACKDKMRPVKKALRMLENPEEKVDEKDQVSHTRQCLLKIGDHIQKCLNEYESPDVAKEWRRDMSFQSLGNLKKFEHFVCAPSTKIVMSQISDTLKAHISGTEADINKRNFWTFVSKFTAFDAHKLFKLYRIACRKREEQREERRKQNTSEKPASQSQAAQPESKQQQHPNWLQLDEVRKRTLGISSPSAGNKIPKIEKIHHLGKDRDYKRQGDVRSPGFSKHDSSEHRMEYRSDNRGYNREKDRDHRRGGQSPHRRTADDQPRYHEKTHYRDHYHRPDDRSRYEGNRDARHGIGSRDYRDRDRDDRRRAASDYPSDSKWSHGFHRQYSSSHHSADRTHSGDQNKDDSRGHPKDDNSSQPRSNIGYPHLTNNPSPTKSYTNYWERGTGGKLNYEHGHRNEHGQQKQDVKGLRRDSPEKRKLPVVESLDNE